jgi:hypothetical protein
VEQEIDHKKQLSSIINDPDRLRHSDIPLLKELVAQYPYFQPLRLILAKLSMETEDAEQTLTTTALYTNGAVLHQFMHRRPSVKPEATPAFTAALTGAEQTGLADEAGLEENAIDFSAANAQPEALAGSSSSDRVNTQDQTFTSEIDAHNSAAEVHEEASANDPSFEDKSLFDEAAELEAASLLEEVYAFGDTDPDQPEEIDCVEEVNDTPADEQETYEEIAEINIHDYDNPIDHISAENEESTYDEISEINIHDYEVSPSENPVAGNVPLIETLEDNFVENIAATDFFTFEEKFIAEDKTTSAPAAATPDHATPGNVELKSGNQGLTLSGASAWATNPGASQTEKDTSELTNYDDDSLPYTFLWWLAKTRKEHSTIFQPYATPKKQSQNELHQQYVEHIFHIQSPFNAEEILNNVPEHQADPKDAKIIDEFIKKDPQITPPRAEQIDNENKAKRSAEDHNDLVSETLAKIYIEQMLYHKAIDTYEKLSLKFPEKSRYFADLIQSIKKKI